MYRIEMRSTNILRVCWPLLSITFNVGQLIVARTSVNHNTSPHLASVSSHTNKLAAIYKLTLYRWVHQLRQLAWLKIIMLFYEWFERKTQCWNVKNKINQQILFIEPTIDLYSRPVHNGAIITYIHGMVTQISIQFNI